MSITRRKFLGFLSLLIPGYSTIKVAKADPQAPPRSFMGHQLHDDVSVSLLALYARSLALRSPKKRWEAQAMFHQAQLSREQGGTIGHKLGGAHKGYLKAVESGRIGRDRSHAPWK